jgi:hypothetical protein
VTRFSAAETAEGMRLETVFRMMNHAGTDDRDLGRQLVASYHRHSSPLVDETLLFPGIPEMLESLSAAGHAMGFGYLVEIPGELKALLGRL